VQVEQGKYGASKDVYFELYEVDGVDLRTDWTPAAADCQISTDGGAFGNSDNIAVVAPTGTGIYKVVLSATEMTGAVVIIKLVDAATKVFLDRVIKVETYGNASAMHAFDPAAQDAMLIAAGYVGDFELGETLHFAFSPIATLSPNGESIRVYKDDSDTAITTAYATLDEIGTTNVFQVSIVLLDTSYDPHADYQVVLDGATIGTATVTAAVATFSIENRYQKPGHRYINK